MTRHALLTAYLVVSACTDAGSGTDAGESSTGDLTTTTTTTTASTDPTSTGPPKPRVVDVVDGAFGPWITGLEPMARIRVYDGAGDLNADGRDDLLIANGAGEPYVVFGTDAPGEIDLADVARGIGGIQTTNSANVHSLTHAGDVNGDGHDDVIADLDSGSNPRSAVLLGGPDVDPMLWQTLDPAVTARFRMWNSTTACGIGDVTGDGLGDSIRRLNDLAYLAEGGPHLAAGANVNSDDFPWHQISMSVYRCVGIGDFNGDGVGDFAITGYPTGATEPDPGEWYNGRVYVFFGGPDLAHYIDSTDLDAGIGGFRILGAGLADNIGVDSLAPAGDVDGDGLQDLLVSAPMANAWSGAFYLVLGREGAAPIKLADPTPGVTRFDAPFTVERLGIALTGKLDLNADGVPDFAAGSPCGLSGLEGCIDRVFVPTGAAFGPTVDLSPTVEAGDAWVFRGGLDGGDNTVRFGTYLTSLDFDGDGRTDLAIASPGEDWNGASSGRVYVILAARLGG